MLTTVRKGGGSKGVCVINKIPLVVIGSPNRKLSIVFLSMEYASTSAGPLFHTARQQEAKDFCHQSATNPTSEYVVLCFFTVLTGTPHSGAFCRC